MPHDVKTLSILSQSLLLFAKGLDSNAIPKLEFIFTHDPSDLPGVSTPWAVSVKLVGLKDINQEDGTKTNSYEKSWVGTGNTPEEAFGDLSAHLRASLADEAKQKAAELNALSEAARSMEAPVLLADLWSQVDPVEQVASARNSTTRA